MKEQECHCCKEWFPEDQMERFLDPYAKAMFGAYDYIWSCRKETCLSDTKNHIYILQEDI